jgi:hypothetical protein
VPFAVRSRRIPGWRLVVCCGALALAGCAAGAEPSLSSEAATSPGPITAAPLASAVPVNPSPAQTRPLALDAAAPCRALEETVLSAVFGATGRLTIDAHGNSCTATAPDGRSAEATVSPYGSGGRIDALASYQTGHERARLHVIESAQVPVLYLSGATEGEIALFADNAMLQCRIPAAVGPTPQLVQAILDALDPPIAAGS